MNGGSVTPNVCSACIGCLGCTKEAQHLAALLCSNTPVPIEQVKLNFREGWYRRALCLFSRELKRQQDCREGPWS